jgi:CHASE3 domain sensor protein
MPSLSQRTRLYLGIVCGVSFVALLANVSLRSAVGFAKSEKSVESVHDAIDLLEMAQGVLTGVDDLQQKIILHEDRPRVVDLTPDRKEFMARIEALDNALSTLPGARTHVERLPVVGSAKLSESTHVLEIYRLKGYDAAIKEARTGPGFQLTTDEGKAVGAIRQSLLQQLQNVAIESAQGQREAREWLEGGIGLAVLVAVLAMIVAMRDSARRFQIEESMRKLLALQGAILDSVNSSIVATDCAGVITSFNRKSE